MPALPVPETEGVSSLVADEISRFTSEQRRLSRERIERENRTRSGLLDEDNQPPEPAADQASGNLQIAALPPEAIKPESARLPELTLRDDVRAAQVELKRLGCYVGSVNGRMTQDTGIGLQTAERNLGGDARSLNPLTTDVLEFLKKRTDKICTGRIGCGPGQAKQGTTCIAAIAPQDPAQRRRARATEDDEPAPRRQRQSPQRDQAAPAARPRVAPQGPAGPSAPASPSRPAINLTM